MKKLIAVILTVALLCAFLPVFGSAETQGLVAGGEAINLVKNGCNNYKLTICVTGDYPEVALSLALSDGDDCFDWEWGDGWYNNGTCHDLYLYGTAPGSAVVMINLINPDTDYIYDTWGIVIYVDNDYNIGTLEGDVDGDGKVTVADARLCLRIAIGLAKVNYGSAPFFECDRDGDDVVGIADARLILRAAIGIYDLAYDEYEYIVGAEFLSGHKDTQYAITDLDGNGINELIIKRNTTDEYIVDIYTLDLYSTVYHSQCIKTRCEDFYTVPGFGGYYGITTTDGVYCAAVTKDMAYIDATPTIPAKTIRTTGKRINFSPITETTPFDNIGWTVG